MLDDPNRKTDPGCTCHLEQSFGAGEPGTYAENAWCVYDAECEVVCTTPRQEYAELIAHALNRMNCCGRNEACRIHDEAYWKGQEARNA